MALCAIDPHIYIGTSTYFYPGGLNFKNGACASLTPGLSVQEPFSLFRNPNTERSSSVVEFSFLLLGILFRTV